MLSLFAVAGLAACGTEKPVSLEPPDPAVVDEALSATQPEPLVDLIENTERYAAPDENCPYIETVGDEEVWTGGCQLPDGRAIEGTLRRYAGQDGAWIAAEHFAVRHRGELLFQLNGSVELFEENDLLTIEVAGALCGGPTWSCVDGPVTLDLAYALYPVSNYPEAYDATVSGVVAAEGSSPISVDGVWSIDAAACGNEPASGTFTLRRNERHALSLDGHTQCDGCGSWIVQGIEAEPYCGIEL